ncbi:MAG: hypothetical protein ACRESG_09095 [Gammaproteobacteria bacterium]
MPRGGARNRSGPSADPDSGRSDKRGVVLTALPAEGYKGDPPRFPLPGCLVREDELWTWAWSTPQAAAWAQQSWRWPIVAMWVRTFVICEGSLATAADKGSLHRFADQIGLTPAGLNENGWKIADDELAAHVHATAQAPSKPRKSARDRMTVVDGNAAEG